MSGIISARAWGKVWAYRSTFLLGLLNTCLLYTSDAADD